jgi:hypothetical protein
MHQRKHICGYPIWVENEQTTERWITRFWDAPEGKLITRCPGCGGRLVPWEIKKPKAPSPEVESALGSALATLVEKVETTLYELDPSQASHWAGLTREARETLEEAGFELTSPPWTMVSERGL